MIKVALVDDHVVLRNALAVLINKLGGFKVMMEADHGQYFMDQLRSGGPHPDIVLLDVSMPVCGGVETAILLQRNYPFIKVIALTVLKSDYTRVRMLKSGVRGYLFKDCETDDLSRALKDVHESGYFFNELLSHEIPHQKPAFFKTPLNQQQRIFLRWASTDLTHKEIAEKMQVGQRTVDSYRDTLFKKLDINSRVGLVKYAIKNGFIEL